MEVIHFDILQSKLIVVVVVDEKDLDHGQLLVEVECYNYHNDLDDDVFFSLNLIFVFQILQLLVLLLISLLLLVLHQHSYLRLLEIVAVVVVDHYQQLLLVSNDLRK